MKLFIFYFCLSISAFAGITRRPYLQNGSSDSMTIMWRTENSTTGIVEFGKTKNYGSIVKSLPGKLHEIKLTKLSPDTKYFYKVKNGVKEQTACFRTFPVSLDTPITFAASGDTRNNISYLKSKNLAIQAWQAGYNPYFNLNNGDIVEKGESLTGSYWQAFFDTTSDLIAYSPLYITTGNHDYNRKIISPGYTENFSFPKNGPDNLSERVYSFDCGNVHIIAAEIHYDPDTPYLPGTEQFNFIINDLASTDKPWKVFITHNPILDSGRSGLLSDKKWNRKWAEKMYKYYVPEFEKYGLNLFISGHDHFYERSIKNNITYLVLATKTGEKFNQKNPYSIRKNSEGGAAVFSVTGCYMYATAGCNSVSNGIKIIDNFVITNKVILKKNSKSLPNVK